MTAKWQQWMPFHIDRFMGSRSVASMHPAARIGYLYLLAAQWQSDDCSIPADDHELAIESGLTELWEAHKASILRKFHTRDDGRLTNAVVEAEWAAAKKIYEKRWGAAIKTNEAKKSAKRTPTKRMAHAKPTVTVQSPDADRDTGTGTGTDTSTETKEQELSTANAVSPRTDSGKADPLEEIYKAYPRKVGRKTAIKAIARAIQHVKARGMPLREAQVWLYHRVQEYARSPAGMDGEFTPHPATWFNQGRYDDEAQEWQIQTSERGSNGHRSESRTRLKPGDVEAVIELFGGSETSQTRSGRREPVH
jgi:uncharacterized protein YdaU (DUF1376 family)